MYAYAHDPAPEHSKLFSNRSYTRKRKRCSFSIALFTLECTSSLFPFFPKRIRSLCFVLDQIFLHEAVVTAFGLPIFTT